MPTYSKPTGGHLRIQNGVLDVPMAEVVLDREGVVSLVGELEPAGVAQHMRARIAAYSGRVGSCRRSVDTTSLSA